MKTDEPATLSANGSSDLQKLVPVFARDHENAWMNECRSRSRAHTHAHHNARQGVKSYNVSNPVGWIDYLRRTGPTGPKSHAVSERSCMQSPSLGALSRLRRPRPKPPRDIKYRLSASRWLVAFAGDDVTSAAMLDVPWCCWVSRNIQNFKSGFSAHQGLF